MCNRNDPDARQRFACASKVLLAIAPAGLIVACAQTGGTGFAPPQSDALPAPVTSQEEVAAEGWPREIRTAKGTVVIYQPQPESLEGDRLRARTAVSINLKGDQQPIFGAVWMDSRLDTNREGRMATITEVSVTQVRLPERHQARADELSALLEQEIPKWNLPISMDRLLTSLELAETRSEASEKIHTDPPRVVLTTEPAVLISIDGEPRLRQEQGAELMRVVNTPFTILLEQSSSTYYLYADAGTWYQASELPGQWSLAGQVPGEVAERAPSADVLQPDTQAHDSEAGGPGPPPKVVIATEPTELIVARGEPEFTPIAGTELLFMSNSDSDVLLDVPSQQYYILLAGRWYTGGQIDGDWRYVRGADLPADFSKIPEDSDMATVLYAVPGTEPSKEAVLDAHIPQTAKIDRRKATLHVKYDGQPVFEPVAGTGLHYAVNTATAVLRVDGAFYAVDNGVWFVAKSATGPWEVATSVPAEIYTIEPDSPLYHVTFVRIYEVTPGFVYVGYTPGYTNTYVYESTIVYGTGYWNPGWYDRYYYPRSATWGYGARWNPWTGWGFGFSYGYGPFTFGIGRGSWYRGGWWGPRRYHGYGDGYRQGYRRGHYAGYRAGSRDSVRSNLYDGHGEARVRLDRKQTNLASTSVTRSNNVYTDRKGDVYRKANDGWQTRGTTGWQASSPGVDRTQTLNRDSRARQRGTQRAGAYRQSRGGRGRR